MSAFLRKTLQTEKKDLELSAWDSDLESWDREFAGRLASRSLCVAVSRTGSGVSSVSS